MVNSARVINLNDVRGSKMTDEPNVVEELVEERRHHRFMDALITGGVGLGIMFIAWMSFTVYETSLSVARLSPLVQTMTSIDSRIAMMVTREELASEVSRLKHDIELEGKSKDGLADRLESLEDRVDALYKKPVR